MTSTENVNPSVVLVHGAYADGSSWSEVIKRLQAAGITATAVPGSGVSCLLCPDPGSGGLRPLPVGGSAEHLIFERDRSSTCMAIY